MTPSTVLIDEIRALSAEIGDLRDDTSDLVRDEVKRGRRRNLMVACLVFLLLALPMGAFFTQQQRIESDRQVFIDRTVQVCEERNADQTAIATYLKRLAAIPRPDSPPPSEAQQQATRDFMKTLSPVDCSLLSDR